MSKITNYVLSNLAHGRGAYADLAGGEAYSAATKACAELIAAGYITRDLQITDAGRKALLDGSPFVARQ